METKRRKENKGKKRKNMIKKGDEKEEKGKKRRVL